MIEFKADCGHTVRARDEDSGGVVRCSYCGRTTSVPEEMGDELDFLFRDVEQQEKPEKKRRKSRRPARAPKKRPPGAFNPFAVVLRLCYAALLISIVIVVGRKFVLPLFQEGGLTGRVAQIGNQQDPEPTTKRRERLPLRDETAPGLIGWRPGSGLHVAAIPPDVKAYYIEADKFSQGIRVAELRNAKELHVNQPGNLLSEGEYIVEVAILWNNKRLKSYPDYNLVFRRAIDTASTVAEQERLADEYFLPDGSFRIFVADTDARKYIVRQYRVTGGGTRAKAVRALFLPRIHKEGSEALAIEELLAGHYLPNEERYRFDNEDVRTDLEYEGVAPADLVFVLDMLRRVGVAPYVFDDGSTKVFMIGIDDGKLGYKELSQPEQ